MNFLGVKELALIKKKLSFFTPFTLGGHNFLISNLFSTIFSVLDALRGGLQVLFGHQKQ
jgi:hypothetical protein